MTEVVEIFEYRKNNDGYWDKTKLHQQVVTKALLIAKALYPSYSLIFLFDNATSHSVYIRDTLRIGDININLRSKQSYLHNNWYRDNSIDKIYPINI